MIRGDLFLKKSPPFHPKEYSKHELQVIQTKWYQESDSACTEWRKIRSKTIRARSAAQHLAEQSISESVENLSGRCAAACKAYALAISERAPAYEAIWQFSRSLGIGLGHVAHPEQQAIAILRALDSSWWKRRFHRCLNRATEHEAIKRGLVSAQRGLHVSDFWLEQHRAKRARIRALLEDLEAVNELGETLDLAELADKSISNLRVRRAELMARIAGFEKFARESGHVALFCTITCPSAMHARLRKNGAKNPRYDGTSPLEASRYLGRLWSQIRANLQRQVIRIYGFRIAEPQHDGTPHWHLLLFVGADHATSTEATLKRYALREAADEPGASRHRFRSEPIDWTRGSATAYVAKYVSKNIDGAHLEAYENNARAHAERVQAWASLWGIRQFQQLGSPPVTIYRECRRISPKEANPSVRRFFAAADGANWYRFTKLMGGPQCRRDALPVRLYREWQSRTGKYHRRPVGWVVRGLQSGDVIQKTRPHEWTIRSKVTGMGIVGVELTDPEFPDHVIRVRNTSITPSNNNSEPA